MSDTMTKFDDTPTIADLVAALLKLDQSAPATVMVEGKDGEVTEKPIGSVTYEYPGFAAINCWTGN